MKKRSAMLMAAGLVIALAVAGAAFSLHATGPASASTPAATRRADTPRVRTVTRIVTVHRTGDPVMAGSGSAAPVAPSSDDRTEEHPSDDSREDPFEDDHGEDHEDEGDSDHEDEGEFEVDD